MALPLCKLSEVALIDEVALNIIGHDSYLLRDIPLLLLNLCKSVRRW